MKIQTKIANKLISTSINDDWYWVQELNDRIKTLSVKHLPCSRKRAVSFTSKSSPTDSCIAEGSTCFATIYVMSFQLREKHTSATTQKETSPLCNLALIMLARSSIGGESHVQTKLWTFETLARYLTASLSKFALCQSLFLPCQIHFNWEVVRLGEISWPLLLQHMWHPGHFT